MGDRCETYADPRGQVGEELLALGRHRTFSRGEVVFHAGDRAESMLVVLTGHFAIRAPIVAREVRLVDVLGPGQCVGELSLVRREQVHTATVVSLGASSGVVVAGSGYRRTAPLSNDVERDLVLLLADRVETLGRRVEELVSSSLEHRVAQRLLELCAGSRAPVRIPLTQGQVGELVGVTRSSVNPVLRRLAADGCLTLERGRVVVHDVRRLRTWPS